MAIGTAEPTSGAAPSRMEHPALLYRSLEDFLRVTVPFVATGLDHGETVFVAARGDNLAALRDEIGSADVRWADTDAWHPHPASRLRAFHDLVTDEMARGSTGFRLIGEPVWPEGPPQYVREWQRYESALSRVLEPFPVNLVCLYDASRLDESIVTAARRTHAVVTEGGSPELASPVFEEPEGFLARWNEPLSAVPSSAAQAPALEALHATRRFVVDRARAAGVSPGRASDLSVAVGEILANAVVHAGGVVGLWTWPERDRFVCHIEDRGPGIADPLAGYRPPRSDAAGGRGLWIARQLVDLLRIARTSTGTAVRLEARRT